MAGLRPTIEAFLFFQGTLIVISLVILALIRLLSAAMPNLAAASAVAPLFLVIQLLFTGFVITKPR
jgi:ABC-type multidrug transport system permease subunit